MWVVIFPYIIECQDLPLFIQKTAVCISLYDVTGRLIKEISNDMKNAGIHQKTFEVTNLSQDVYFIRLDVANHSEVQKIVLIK